MRKRRKPTRKLYPSEVKRRLASLEQRWPDHLILFATGNDLLLVNWGNKRVLDSFLISCDGGDPGFRYEGDEVYLDL